MPTTGVTSYVLNNVNVADPNQLKNFISIIIPGDKKYFSSSYDAVNKVLTVNTKETTYSTDTMNTLTDIVQRQYPNPPAITPSAQDLSDLFGAGIASSPSVYGYFSSTTAIDGDVVISKNTSLTRNMYYNNLTVNAGVTLKTNGWRIVVADTLNLYGTISNDGGDASGIVAGTGSAPVYSTYLGTGTSGGAGLTGNGNGNPGVSATYSCTGGGGGDGGKAANYTGGSGGTTMAISPVDGGINMLSTMPVAFLGRLISANYYLMGATGGGSGACSKGNAATVKSGAGGGGAGFLVIAAKTINGNGTISARGGDGSSATWTGSGTQQPGGIGGGAGGGAGCIVVISQGAVPSSLTFNVRGGYGGSGVAPGVDGQPGQPGNVFVLAV